MKTEAFVNRGRWLAECPTCGSAIRIQRGDELLVCAVCFPGLRATAFIPKPENPKMFIQVPDLQEREEARHQVIKQKQAHQIIYKQKPADVEKLLAKRPVTYQNWNDLDGVPAQDLDALRAENKEHGVRS